MQAMTQHATRLISWLAFAAALGGCTPALNWRQVNVDTTGVTVLLPCKPDHATRTVALRVASQDMGTNLSLHGCEASNMQFTVGVMLVPSGLPMDEAMAAWRLASLAALDAEPNQALPVAWPLKGAKLQTLPVRAHVVTPTHQAQWAWFADGNKIYQAAVYGKATEKNLPDAAETYFSGIKLP